MKTFYSCVDSYLVTPQPMQHLVMRECAKKAGGAIEFYGSEEVITAKVQSFILPKLQRTPGIDGVIFFSLEQFRYGEKPNITLMREIIEKGYEVHFAKEGISLRTIDDFNRWLSFILVVDYSKRRDRSPFWKELVGKVETNLPKVN